MHFLLRKLLLSAIYCSLPNAHRVEERVASPHSGQIATLEKGVCQGANLALARALRVWSLVPFHDKCHVDHYMVHWSNIIVV